MATIAELKQCIDLVELADRLGLQRPNERSNYHSPHHKDKTPSLAIPSSSKTSDHWRDYSGDDDAAAEALDGSVDGDGAGLPYGVPSAAGAQATPIVAPFGPVASIAPAAM